MRRTWEIKQSASLPSAIDLYIYGSVEADYYDWWGDKHESETSADHFREELAKYPDATEMNIYINSLGGSVLEGTAIYNQLKRHKAHKTVYIDGFACSIASVIAMAGDKVIMPRNTMMMIHNPWTMAVGNAKELRKQADDLEAVGEASRQAYLMKAGDKLPEDKLIEMLDAETYLTAEKCVEYGLADEFADDIDLEAAKKALEEPVDDDKQQSNPELEKLRAQVAELEKLRNEQKQHEQEDAHAKMQTEMQQRLDKAADFIINNYFGKKKEENT